VTDLIIFDSVDDETGAIVRHIVGHHRDGAPLEILEAGCGRQWKLKLDGLPFHLTGVDINEGSIKARIERHRDLDDAVVGDLRDVDLGDRRFDVIYSSFVLEHVPGAEKALRNVLRFLKPDGILILRIPDRDTAHGFVTRVTPHWFHVLYARYAAGYRNAGKPGFYPYPTHYDPIVGRTGIHAFCVAEGLEVVDEFATCTYRNHNTFPMRVVRAGAYLVELASFGRYSSRFNNVTFVIRKAASRPADPAGS
jgi:SAM-dependent methyltransferase